MLLQRGERQRRGTTAFQARVLLKSAVMDAWCHADTRSAWQKLTLEDYNREKGTYLREGAETMLSFSQGVWWPEISCGAGKHLKAALLNEKPVKQALDGAQAAARAAVEAAGGRIE